MYKYFLPDEYVKDIFQIRTGKIEGKRNQRNHNGFGQYTCRVGQSGCDTRNYYVDENDARDAEYNVTIVSNNNEMRVKAFCEPLGHFIHK